MEGKGGRRGVRLYGDRGGRDEVGVDGGDGEGLKDGIVGEEV